MISQSKIRVLLVDDSPIALRIMQSLLSDSNDIQVVGTAANGKEAFEILPVLNPDVICTDFHMPVMDGLEFTHAVMKEYPCPILVMSVSVEKGSPGVFQILEAGALDVYPKPHGISGENHDKLALELASKIRNLAGVNIFRRTTAGSPVAPSMQPISRKSNAPVRIVVIGASTGGPQALHEILSELPDNFPVPVVCVQHIMNEFLPQMVTWLDEAARLPVRMAIQGEQPQAGVVYFAHGDTHLEFDKSGKFDLTQAPLCDSHRPSVTVTLRSAAHVYGAGSVGVLLTGMGRDGATGMVEVTTASGVTIAQNEASSIVYGMPGAAVELGAALHVLPIEQVAPALTELTKRSD